MAGDVRGEVIWVDVEPTRGREQGGRRPALVVASASYLETITNLVPVLPITSRDRKWPNHVRLEGPGVGLDVPSFAMTEQPRTIDRGRIHGTVGHVDSATMSTIDLWLRDLLGL